MQMWLKFLDSCASVSFLHFFFSPPSGQTAGPASQQTSNPDYNAWVDFYRQPMAYFNQGAQQTQAPGLQVRTDSVYLSGSGRRLFHILLIVNKSHKKRPKQTMCLSSVPWHRLHLFNSLEL